MNKNISELADRIHLVANEVNQISRMDTYEIMNLFRDSYLDGSDRLKSDGVSKEQRLQHIVDLTLLSLIEFRLVDESDLFKHPLLRYFWGHRFPKNIDIIDICAAIEDVVSYKPRLRMCILADVWKSINGDDVPASCRKLHTGDVISYINMDDFVDCVAREITISDKEKGLPRKEWNLFLDELKYLHNIREETNDHVKAEAGSGDQTDTSETEQRTESETERT